MQLLILYIMKGGKRQEKQLRNKTLTTFSCFRIFTVGTVQFFIRHSTTAYLGCLTHLTKVASLIHGYSAYTFLAYLVINWLIY